MRVYQDENQDENQNERREHERRAYERPARNELTPWRLLSPEAGEINSYIHIVGRPNGSLTWG